MPISHFWIPPISSHPSPPLALLLQQSQHPCRVQVKSLISALYPIFSRFPKDSAPKAFLSLHRPSIRFISLLSSLQPSNSSFHSCPFQQLHVHYGTSPWPRSTCRHQIQCHLSLFLASRWPLRAGWHLPRPLPSRLLGNHPDLFLQAAPPVLQHGLLRDLSLISQPLCRAGAATGPLTLVSSLSPVGVGGGPSPGLWLCTPSPC